MSRPRCTHDDDDRLPSGRCGVCRREADARRRAIGGRSTVGDEAGSRPSRAVSLDVLEERGALSLDEARARKRLSLGSGGFKTAEGGGSPRAWVVCRCALCASSRVTFSDGTERRQDGERDLPHPVYYRRHPALTSTREEVVIDADGEDRRVVVTTTDFPPRWELIEEASTRGNAQRPPVRPATAA